MRPKPRPVRLLLSSACVLLAGACADAPSSEPLGETPPSQWVEMAGSGAVTAGTSSTSSAGASSSAGTSSGGNVSTAGGSGGSPTGGQAGAATGGSASAAG